MSGCECELDGNRERDSPKHRIKRAAVKKIDGMSTSHRKQT